MIRMEEVEGVRTREDLAALVLALREDLLTIESEWENPTLDRFLGALAAWCVDMPGYFLNKGEKLPDQPDWNLVCKMLLAASVYE